MDDTTRRAAARAAWPFGPDDFDQLAAEYDTKQEDREFRRNYPTREAKTHAIAIRNRAIAEGND